MLTPPGTALRPPLLRSGRRSRESGARLSVRVPSRPNILFPAEAKVVMALGYAPSLVAKARRAVPPRRPEPPPTRWQRFCALVRRIISLGSPPRP